jgi:hypothetical protein
MARRARIERATSESKVVVELDLDGTGHADISTGVGFYDHMLTVKRSAKPWATSPASVASVTHWFRSTRRWRSARWICRGARTSCTAASPRGRSRC